MTVSFNGPIKKYTGGESSYSPVCCSSLRGLIVELSDRYGEGFVSFINGTGSCLILVNGRGTMLSGGLDTPLVHGDKVEFLPVVIAG